MSKPFVPGRIVGGSVIAERDPFSVDALLRFRGIEILEPAEPGGATGPERGPYRTSSPAAPQVRRVVVCEGHEFIEGEQPFLDVFEMMVAELMALGGSPAPRLLHALGRDGRVHAVVMEAVEGVSLASIVEGLWERGERMPVPVALAVAHALVPLWQIAGDVRVHVGSVDVLVTRTGHVRVLPRLASMEARQVVGAAVGILDAPVVTMAPEQLFASQTVEQSPMYTLGMLLYEMLAGPVHLMLGLSTTWEILSRIHARRLPSVDSLQPELPPHVTAFVAQAMAYQPSDRFASWRELSACLAAVRSSLDPVGPEELAAWVRSLPRELQDEGEPPPDLVIPTDWQALPCSGLVPVPWPERTTLPTQAPTAAPFVEAGLVYAETDQRPMYACGELLVDARPVTAAEHERFAIATASPSRNAVGDEPCTSVTFEQAEAYARWAGKRLPTDEEWTAIVAALGAEKLGVGEVWEWTATPNRGGHVVRGGRWRDAWERPPVPENRSHETAMAVDVGFRCVMDRGRR